MENEDKEVFVEITMLDLEERYGKTANGRWAAKRFLSYLLSIHAWCLSGCTSKRSRRHSEGGQTQCDQCFPQPTTLD